MTEFMGLAEKVNKFNQQALKHIESQTLNPFSGRFSRSPSPRPKFNKDEYGKPAAGSLTELRGKKAHSQISREVLELCEVIHDMGRRRRDSDGDEHVIIPFGELFAFYTKISDKVVGLLIAAKKRGFVWFEPEILFQRRDDDVLIALMIPIGEIRNIINRQISASPSPAPPAPAVTEKTSPPPSPLASAQQGSYSSSGISSTSGEQETSSSSLTQPAPTEEIQSSSSSKIENEPKQTVVLEETFPSTELSVTVEEAQSPAYPAPSEGPGRTPSTEVEPTSSCNGSEAAKQNTPTAEQTLSSTASPDTEQDASPSTEPTPSTGEETGKSSDSLTLKIIVESEQVPSADVAPPSCEIEQTEAGVPRLTEDGTFSPIAPETQTEIQETIVSPTPTAEPVEPLPSTGKVEQIVPSDETDAQTPPSNGEGEKTLA